VVARVLAREMGVARVKKDPLAAAPVRRDKASQFRAVGASDDEGARRIGSEVYSECKRHIGQGRPGI
jgi:hypothetical protein